MKGATLFVDRDGTLIEEPPDNQVDSLKKVRFMPGVFAALAQLTRLGFRLVMVTNQDGLGTPRFPRAAFEETQAFILEAFSSQGVRFDAVFVCPHSPTDGCRCRKPKTGLVEEYVRERHVDLSQSAVIGDRDTDMELAANLGVRGLTVRRDGSPKETRIHVSVNLDAAAPLKAETGIGFFDHMLEQLGKHGGFSLDLACQGDLEIDEHHTVEDCALALGDALRRALGTKHGIGRYGFLLAMDESEAQVALDLSGRPFVQFSATFRRDEVGGFPTELVPHFFRSLGEALGAAIHVKVTGENTHHMIEACFKGVGRALRDAIRREGLELPSTKGLL